MINHTPEPWLINENCADEVGVLCAENTQEFGSITPILLAYGDKANANARRIVACVNSLAGVPNELLQDDDKNIISRYTEHLKKETVRQANLLAEVTAQRDELLLALKRSNATLTKDLEDLEPLDVFKQTVVMIKNAKQIMRDAIAKCEVKNDG